MLERMRLNTFCGVSMRRMTLVVGILTALKSISLIVFSGLFLYESFKTGKYGTTHYERLPYRFETYRNFGAYLLAFGALWLIMTMVYAAAYMTYRPLWFLPWLVLEAFSIPFASAMIIGVAIEGKNRLMLLGLIFILLLLLSFQIVFSYYLELQDGKKKGVRPQEYKPVSA